PVRVDDRLTGRVSKRIELAAYLIAAESVTNAVKHSGATSVLITLETHDETLVLTVRDDGCGGATTRPGGGIDGLADRASALGGALTLDSPRGRGTTLSVVLPLAPP
ncbi:MAG: sensor histidine kinase, partial [Rhodococcus sp.]|uniref:sensor histidine kinase n=2 Tax=Rhodococcus TaxID=1827 RepID=UPI00169F1B58|nr:sensor histidine kinase [Rhodococcus sp. (in: high G+C Gram-positive bacteria)]